METITLQRQALLEKSEKVKEIKGLIQKYRAIGIANLYKVRASQLQEIRKKLEGTAQLNVVKNSLMKKAIEDFEVKPHIGDLKEYLNDPNLLLFTDLNPFKLVSILEKSRVKDYAKAGDVATNDIIVPAGNTGLPPGPIISQLGSVGIPTRIESGSVWVNRDTVVARRGEIISQSLAPILPKLGIKPMEMGLSLKVVYDDGLIIPREKLSLRLEEYKEHIGQGYAQALNLALNAAYPMAETITTLVQIASAEARNLAINASILIPETIADLVRKAYAEAMILESKIHALGTTK